MIMLAAIVVHTDDNTFPRMGIEGGRCGCLKDFRAVVGEDDGCWRKLFLLRMLPIGTPNGFCLLCVIDE